MSCTYGLASADRVVVELAGEAYSPPQLAAPLASVAVVSNGFEIGPWTEIFATFDIDGESPAIAIYPGWSDTGLLPEDYAWASTPVLTVSAEGHFVLKLDAPAGRHLAFLLKGVDGNGLDTGVVTSVGGV